MVDKKEELQKIGEKIRICKDCALYKTATRAVPGEGKEDAKIMFIGEGPGFHEDQEGRPFVGAAGKLLNNLIESIGLKRGESFITNVVKHRPPENRDPLPEEIKSCNRWLDEQINIVNPKVIVTLGRFSMGKFIQGVTISKVHGQGRFVNGKIIIPMFHPAAALRDGSVMAATKEDFKKIPLFLSNNTESVQKNSPQKEVPEEDSNEKTQLPLGFDQDQQKI